MSEILGYTEEEMMGMNYRYEGNLGKRINLICNRYGNIINYNASIYVERMDVAEMTDFVITSNRWEYYGYCQDCSKEGDSASPSGEPRKRRY